jgi:hypothetical protein
MEEHGRFRRRRLGCWTQAVESCTEIRGCRRKRLLVGATSPQTLTPLANLPFELHQCGVHLCELIEMGIFTSLSFGVHATIEPFRDLLLLFRYRFEPLGFEFKRVAPALERIDRRVQVEPRLTDDGLGVLHQRFRKSHPSREGKRI